VTDPNKDLFGPKPAKSEDNVVQFPNVKSDSPDNALLSDLAAITKLKRQLAVSPSESDAFKLMNRHHATITIEQKFYIIQELNTINLITEETLIKQFRNCKFSFGDDKPISIAILWLNSGSRRECDEFVCDPKTVYNPESPIFNKFRGFGTQAVKGDCSLILDYFKNDVCSAKDKRYHFVMSWCSHMFQKPWEKPEVAFALTGPKGIGKSLFFWILKRLLDGKSRAGRALKYYHKISKSKGLLPRFNVHLEENILLVSEEVSFIGDKELIGSINDFITSDTLTVEIKNGPIRDVNSYSRLGITLNDEHIVPASPDERRYAVFKVSDARQGQKAYFKAIINQLNNSGAEALMYEFMHYDIRRFRSKTES
jgi:putative DNA primase/helicase